MRILRPEGLSNLLEFIQLPSNGIWIATYYEKPGQRKILGATQAALRKGEQTYCMVLGRGARTRGPCWAESFRLRQ